MALVGGRSLAFTFAGLVIGFALIARKLESDDE